MNLKYAPVDPDYLERIEQVISEKNEVTIHFFEKENTLKKVTGKIKELYTSQSHEEFLVLEDGVKIRVDRIIVLNGKPGPAYDEYDSYALACLDCMGGMD